ncbi:RIO1-domain-containing protein [Cutaneotrichosporon oleaginosum]|uniref:Serine/threonine-protein kinase RIO2 n=1 Tax=Cutaneotrichosporon oleaginosum TaxID=879819 RepID=A0A0J0XXZ6_9TREE|nr:RIO1-domain-containing protein [Cutaneotrichosporon oleaginosum]KLT45915.1 RIO1-domain-containing protein [Cutaneotrichosporon oleaginosum]TXT06613.1 hypothetical protein COLE_05944 [Cutaneotrichosporon oleaginosum]
MRLDATDLRYITDEEFRVLQAAEMGSRNHEVVPTPLLAEISKLRGGNVAKLCGQLARRNLIARVANTRYDGYRLTYGGLDYLALKTFHKRKPPSVSGVGSKIGVGKESDIYLVQDGEGEKRVLKLHRLGRISFRAIKSKRDYLGKRASASWMYMSRLSAQKEFAFMKVLYDHGFPVPTPIDQSRHCVVMSLVDSQPLRAVMSVPDPAKLYGELMEMIMRFARASLIHGDFNEFNILIKRKTYEAVVIDFPQMVSTHHENAEYFFNRDVNCIRRFFRKRFRFEGTTWPVWADVVAEWDDHEKSLKAADAEGGSTAETEEKEEEKEVGTAASEEGAGVSKTEPSAAPAVKFETPALDVEEKDSEADDADEPQFLRLDLAVEASGFGRDMQRQLEDYMIEVQDIPNEDLSDEEEDDDDDDSDDDEGEEGKAPATEEAPEEAAAKLEKLRLHRLLGNDGDPDDEPPAPVSLYSEEEEEESDSGDSDDSVGPAPSDYTQYVRAPRAPRQRVNVSKVSKLGKVDELRETVAGEMARAARSQGPRTKGTSKVGRAKGHKWKSNASYQIGKDTGW